MKHLHTGNPRRSIIAIALVLALSLLAYGTVASQENPTTPKYPKLDPVLQKIVAGFEDETWTATQAAAQAPEHHGSAVLVEIDLQAASVDAVDTWMGQQEITPRFKDAEYIPPHIYAYVEVSLLGALSNRDGVVIVHALESIEREGERTTGGIVGQAGPPPKPKLPLELKGYPYPKLAGTLNTIAQLYEEGLLTAEQAAAQTPGHQGTNVFINAHFQDPASATAAAAWLVSNGALQWDPETPATPSFHLLASAVIAGYIPVSLLADFSYQPNVIRIDPGGDSGADFTDEEKPQRQTHNANRDDSAQQTPPTPTPTPFVVFSACVGIR